MVVGILLHRNAKVIVNSISLSTSVVYTTYLQQQTFFSLKNSPLAVDLLHCFTFNSYTKKIAFNFSQTKFDDFLVMQNLLCCVNTPLWVIDKIFFFLISILCSLASTQWWQNTKQRYQTWCISLIFLQWRVSNERLKNSQVYRWKMEWQRSHMQRFDNFSFFSPFYPLHLIGLYLFFFFFVLVFVFTFVFLFFSFLSSC